MIMPSKKQLKELYPNVNAEYLADCIERQMVLIDLEQQKVDEVDLVITKAMNRLIGEIDEVLLSNIPNKNKVIDAIVDKIIMDLIIELSEVEVDGIIQMHETSAYLYQWIIEKHFTDNIYEEVGGEQSTKKTSVSKNKLTKEKTKEIVNKKYSQKTLGDNIGSILNELKAEIKAMYKDKDGKALKQNIRKSFNKAKDKIKNETRYVNQNVAYDAVEDVNISYSDELEAIYYRVEVLDSSICLMCLNLDGSINKNPLGLVHRNCRGIDVLLFRDEDGKYYDTNMKGYGHKLKTSSFSTKFSKLSKKQQRQMLGKANYEYYTSGKLKVDDFISYGRQITKAEAEVKMDIKSLRKSIKTPMVATKYANALEKVFNKSIEKMNSKELLAYEKVLGYQKQLYDLVPNKNYKKSTKQSYIDKIDSKYARVQAQREKLRKE